MKKKAMPLPLRIPQQMLSQLADLIAKAVVARIPKDIFRRSRKKTPKKLENPMVLDTSAIIDGRISEVAKIGFLAGNVLVPQFVLSELKHVADSQDMLKRARGRRGLELLERIKKTRGIRFKIVEDEQSPSREDNDERLISLTKKQKGRLITCDYNLNKKASVEGVKVLNINELANALKTMALPGEDLHIAIVAAGKGKNQGVGYLPDGTMIVVDDGIRSVGEEVDVIVSRVFQTAAGRMIFAKLKNG